MASFEDIKEQIQNTLKNQWELFQESSLYIQVKERYENLTPAMQKLTLWGSAVLAGILIVLSLPISYYSESATYVSEFEEEKRQLVRDLLKTSRESQESPDLAIPPSMEQLKSQVDAQIQSARLVPEQILGTQIIPASSKLIPNTLSEGTLKISLAKLNLKQLIDLGYQLQSLNPSVKMLDLQIEANRLDPRYFDVTYKMAALAVPNKLETPAEPEIDKRIKKEITDGLY